MAKKRAIRIFKTKGINTTGGKIEISSRIKTFLLTGEIIKQAAGQTEKETSTFNWSNAALSLSTLLTNNYKNTENVRAFFTAQIGNHFHFTVRFMRWTKQNVGKTLAEAIAEWNRQNDLKKNKTYKSEISPQFEYNRYMRAFLADNSDKSSRDAIKCWKLKEIYVVTMNTVNLIYH